MQIMDEPGLQHQRLIHSEAEQLSKHMIQRSKNTMAAVCQTLQTRTVELRGKNLALKRSASELIRETGKHVRRDVQSMVDGVHASTVASEQRAARKACGEKISGIWKRNR